MNIWSIPRYTLKTKTSLGSIFRVLSEPFELILLQSGQLHNIVSCLQTSALSGPNPSWRKDTHKSCKKITVPHSHTFCGVNCKRDIGDQRRSLMWKWCWSIAHQRESYCTLYWCIMDHKISCNKFRFGNYNEQLKKDLFLPNDVTLCRLSFSLFEPIVLRNRHRFCLWHSCDIAFAFTFVMAQRESALIVTPYIHQ